MAEFELKSDDGKINVQLKKNVQDKKVGKVGEVAHYHPRDNETETWEQACLFVDHFVNEPGGLTINDTVHKGKNIIPTCVANYLTQMEQAAELEEIKIFRSGSIERIINRN